MVKVLVVDDEATMRKMVRLVLQKAGFQVFDTANGTDAIVVAQQHPIDVLVTDVVMDEMDGWAVAHSLVKRQPDLPVLFISGYPVDFEFFKQQHARCAFLPKPFQLGELTDAIGDLAGRVA